MAELKQRTYAEIYGQIMERLELKDPALIERPNIKATVELLTYQIMEMEKSIVDFCNNAVEKTTFREIEIDDENVSCR